MNVDDLVDLGHDSDRLAQGDHDLLVVGDVLGGESSSFSILKPLLADLIATDMEVPDLFGNTLEAYRPRSGRMILIDRRGV